MIEAAPPQVPEHRVRGPAIRAGFGAAGALMTFAGLWLKVDLGTALVYLGCLFIIASVVGTVRAERRP